MALRDSWIEKREAAQAGANGSRNMSQMHLARLGVITEEMQYVAVRERLDPYKHPREVVFMDALPRTHLGKVDRGKLRKGPGGA